VFCGVKGFVFLWMTRAALADDVHFLHRVNMPLYVQVPL